MVKALTPDEILEALDAWHLERVKEPGWRTRSNDQGWRDVTGFMVHHTGNDGPDKIELKTVTDGRPDLSGPLAQFGLDDDGVVHLVAAGAANHAGGGDEVVLKAVQLESYDDFPPPPRFTHEDFRNGKPGAVIGNPRFMGVETFYNEELSAKARATMPILAAAMIWALDRKDTDNAWTARSVIGHKEWQKGKPDPRKVNMKVLRRQIQALLDAGPTHIQFAHLATKEWFLMPNIPTANLDQIRKAIWTQPAAVGPSAPTMWRMLTTMSAQVASLQAAVGELAKNPGLTAAELVAITKKAAEEAVANALEPMPGDQDIPEPIPPEPKGRGGAVAPIG
jgi:hypothetical protein